jgi:hypothetical protein
MREIHARDLNLRIIFSEGNADFLGVLLVEWIQNRSFLYGYLRTLYKIVYDTVFGLCFGN